MIVAMEEGLNLLRQAVEGAGHTVVPLYGYSGAVDAIVYQNGDMTDLTPAAQNFNGDGRGIFVVCARHMTESEVVTALKAKSYSGLF